MPPIVHYYHIYCSGSWQEPWQDQITAIRESGLYEELESLKIGLVGDSANIQIARDIVTQFDKVEIVAESFVGFEQETLDILYKDVMNTNEEKYYLYGHTKGAAYWRPVNKWWRRDMVYHTVTRWQDCVNALDKGYDAAGIYWRLVPIGMKSPVNHNHFSGNFWFAKGSYLKTLGQPLRNTRYDAEAWIGANLGIKAFELHGGVPRIPMHAKEAMVLDRTLGDGETLLVLVQSRVLGPTGTPLKPGTFVRLSDSPYVQILLKSGSVVLWS